MQRTPMSRAATILVRIGLASVAGILLLLAATAALAPYLVDLAAVRDRVAAELSQRLGAEVRCPSVRLALFPLPRLAFDQASIKVPGTVDVTAESLSLRPQLRPLMHGQLRAAKVRIDGARVRIQVTRPDIPEQAPGSDRAEALPRARAVLQRVATELAASPLAGGELVVADGRLEIVRSGARPLIVERIRATAHVARDGSDFDLEAASDLWSELSANGTYDPARATGSARIRVGRLRVESLGVPLEFKGVRPNAPEPTVDVSIRTNGAHGFGAELRGTVPELGLRRDGDELALRNVRLAGSVETDGERFDVRIEELRTDDPSARLSGRLRQAAEGAELDLRGSDLLVEQARRVATFAAGESRPVRATFDLLRGGTVPEITVRSRAPDLKGLAAHTAIEVAGRLQDGRLHVPGIDLDLERVNGLVKIAGGFLIGTQVSAQLGGSKAADGEVRVGLRNETPELFVNAPLEADARDVDALLRRLVKDESFQRGIARVSGVTGTLAGRLSIAGTRTQPQVNAEVSALDLSARVEGITAPVRATGGGLRFGPEGFSAEGTRVSAGGSELGDLALRVAAGAPFEATAGRSRIVLGEVYPWMTASRLLPPSPRNPKSLAGTVRAESLRLTVPAGKSSGARFELRGSVDDFVAEPEKDAPWTALKSPLSFSAVALRHDAGAGSSLKAAFAGPQEMRGEIDLRQTADRLEVGRFRLRDAQSEASLKLSAGTTDADIEFQGRIHRQTLAALYGDALPFTSAQGDVRVHTQFAAPQDSSLEGTLDATDVVLPAPGGGSLRVSAGHVEAKGNSVKVEAKVSVGADDFSLAGRLSRSGSALLADLDVTAGQVRWANIAPLLPGPGVPDAAGAKAKKWPSVNGTVRLSVDAFTFGDLTWRPARAVVTLAPGATTVSVTEAAVCGVSTPGTINVGADGLSLAFDPAAREQPLDLLKDCLALPQETVTGQYTLTAHLAARGAASEIARQVEGQFDFQAANGRLYGMGLTAKLLSVWAIATGGVMSLPDVNKDGLPYDQIRVRGDVSGSSLLIREASLDGPVAKWAGEGTIDVGAKTVDLTFLVTLFTTAGSAVGKIPLLGNFLGGDLLTVPVRATGPVEDLQVTALSPSAVSKELVRKMTNTLKLPYTLIEPLVPRGAKP